MELPELLSADHVEGPDLAAGSPGSCSAESGAHHDHIPVDGGRRGHGVDGSRPRVGHAVEEIHLASFAEVGEGAARFRVQGDEAGISGAYQNPSLLLPVHFPLPERDPPVLHLELLIQ